MVDPCYLTPEDIAAAAELLAAWGRSNDGQGGRVDPVVRDIVNAAADQDRSRELAVGVLHVLGGLLPGIWNNDDVQQALTLTAIINREGLTSPLNKGDQEPEDSGSAGGSWRPGAPGVRP